MPCWIELSFFHPAREHRWLVDRIAGTVSNFWEMLADSGDAQRTFMEFCANPLYHGLRPATCLEAEAITNVVLYLLHGAEAGFWYLRADAIPSERLKALRFLFHLLGLGLELYLVRVYEPSMPPDVTAVPVRTGKRKRLDFPCVLSCLKKAREVGGSSNTVMRVESGRKDLDQVVLRVTCLLHRRRMLERFRGARTLSLAWDPGTYGGSAWNVGLVASTCADVDGGYAGDLLPKVVLWCF